MNSQSNDCLLAFFGHHKCATSWIRDILQKVCSEIGLNFFNAHSAQNFNYNIEEFVKEKEIDFLCYTNADYDYIKSLKKIRGFHVIRDPRDIAVSAYFSHLYSHPTEGWSDLVEHRNKLKQLSKYEGLIAEINFRKKQFKEMYNWNYNQLNVVELKMENIISNPYLCFAEILTDFGIVSDRPMEIKTRWQELITITNRKIQKKLFGKEISDTSLKKLSIERLFAFIYENEFSKKSGGRKAGQENIKSHYRKGLAGDWQNHFQEEHKNYFKENYNDLLVKLGYETDDNW